MLSKKPGKKTLNCCNMSFLRLHTVLTFISFKKLLPFSKPGMECDKGLCRLVESFSNVVRVKKSLILPLRTLFQ